MRHTEDSKDRLDGGGAEGKFGAGGFRWLNCAQFGGALNDNFLKLAIIYALGVWWTGKDPKEILGLVGAAFALPFLLFLGIGGNFADRFSKSKVAQVSKFFEIVVAGGAVVAFYFQSVWGLFAVAFLMSTQSAIFGPVKYGIIPELVGRSGIAKANGYIQSATYLAIIAGTLLAPAVSGLSSQNYVLMGAIAGAIAIAGWMFSLGIPRTRSSGSTRPISPLILPDLIKTLRYIHSDGFLSLAVWGSAYFSFVAGFAQLNLLSYGTEHLGLGGAESSTVLFLFIAFGIGAGSLMAGKLSRRGIEFGIVPVGAGMIAICSLGLGFLWTGGFWEASLLCGAMGVGAGLFIVPVESFIQYRSNPARRGEVVAATGWLSWAGILAASALVYALPAIGVGAAGGFVIVGIMVVGLFAFAMYQLPDFFVRFFVMIITRFYFRMNVEGQDNVPAQGPALIVTNHTSLLDAAFLLASQPRRIRFLMEREYLESSSAPMRCLFQLMGVIPVSKKATPKDIMGALLEARAALRDGWLVGVFPEGTLSRTGHMLPFKRGYQKIVKDTGAGIVPSYIDGAYGTRASYAFEQPKPLSTGDFRRTVGLVFGEMVSDQTGPNELRDLVGGLAEQASLQRGWSQGSVGRRLVRSCRANWNRAAVRDSSGKRLNYGEFLTGVIAVGGKLLSRLGDGEKIVGVMLPPSVAGSVVNVALALNRKVSANINYTSSAEAIGEAIKLGGIKTVVTSRVFLEKTGIRLGVANVIFMEDVAGTVGLGAKVGAFLMARFLPAGLLSSHEGWSPDEMLTVLFSSGSTALPKGIMLSHRNVTSNIDAFSSVARVRKGDSLLGVLPFFHSMGYTTTLWFPLLRGIEACCHHHPLECDHIEKLCLGGRVTIVVGTPTFMMAWARKIGKECLGNLRWACAGAEKMRPRLADLFENKFGIRPMEGYGTTECSPVVAVNVPDVDVDGVCQKGVKEGTAGRALPNILCRVVDRETGETVATNCSGVLLVKGPSVMLGYLGNPKKTAEVLVDGWYNTGDIATIDEDGFISITDRLSRFSKIGGEMVSHTAVEEEIRSVAGKRIPTGTAGLVITGVEDEKRGEKLVVVYENDIDDVAGIKKLVLESDMPNLWKPASQNWVAVDKIPTLGTGKLDLGQIKLLARKGENE